MKQINEGLRPNDLVDMVFDNFEVDSFKSKMGEDRDVCVVSFKARERGPAKDMMEFIEKGYGFVLDADVSAGEDKDGMYHIFVELKRTPAVYEHIQELLDGVKRLTNIAEWKFKYHKNNRFQSLDEQSLRSLIPGTPDAYDMMVENIRVESIKRFFSKTFKNELIIEGNKITVLKPFGSKLSFSLVEFGKIDDLQVKITETVKIDTKSMAEVMWLTKVLGDFNITKYGDQFVLEDGKKSMIIKMEEF
jgi:hypothetical protein